MVVNLKWAGSYGMLFSLGEVHGTHEHSADSFMRVLTGCLKLGSGRGFSDEMVGHGPAPWAEWCDALSMAAVIVAALVLAIGSWRTSRDARHGGLLALSWIAVVAALYALPEITNHHHWPLTIPFVPVAAALALQGVAGELRPAQRPIARIASLVLVGAVLGLRVARIARPSGSQQDIREGVVTRKWDPGLNALGRFANRPPLGRGLRRRGLGRGDPDLLLLAGAPRARRRALLELPGFGPARGPARRVRLERGLRRRPRTAARPRARQPSRSSRTPPPGWRVAPVDQELAAIDCVRALKLVRDQLRPR